MSDSTQHPVSFLITPDPNDKRPLPEIIADYCEFPLQFHDVDGKRYYAISDWIAGVAQTDEPHKYWNSTRQRHPYLNTVCKRFPYRSKDGKFYQMHYADVETIWQITGLMRTNMGIVYQILTGQELPKSQEKSLGFVYLMGIEEHPDLFKIGKTRNLAQRLYNIDGMTPFTPYFVHYWRVLKTRRLELKLHQYLHSNQIKKEWFRFTQDQIKWLKSLSEEEILHGIDSKKAKMRSRRLGIDLATGQPLLTVGETNKE